MRFGVLRVDGQGLPGGAGGVLGAVGARVEGGDLGGNGRALRVGLGGQPIRFERLRDLAEGFEVSAANELEVGCGRRGLRRPGLRPGGERRAESGPEGRQEHQRRATRHEIELFHAASVLTRAGAPARPLPAMKILLVRLRLIGDVVFTTPAVTAIRDAFPEAEITYLVEPAAAPVVQGHPGIDAVKVVPHLRGWRRIAADLALARELRRTRFDLVVDFHGGPRASFLTWATGAPRRVGYAVKGRSWMYTEVVPRPADLRPRHSVENQWDLLPHLGRPVAAAPDRVRHRVRMEETCRGEGVRHEPPGRGRHRSPTPARGRPRERRKPLPPLARGPLRRAGCATCGERPGSAYHPHVRAVRSRGGARDRRAGDGSGCRKASRIASGRATSTRWPSCGAWWPAPRSTSAGTAGRCMSRRRRTCR